MNIFNELSVDPFSIIVLSINLGIAFLMLASLRFILGFIANVNAKDELTEKDNPAFGISLAGVIIGVTIMLTGVIYGEASDNYKTEIIAVFGYGALGISLMTLTKVVFDKISLPNLDVHKEIINRNVAVAVLDAGNVIATAIIVRAVMMWTESVTLKGALMVLIGYILSQILLTLASKVQRFLYRRYHDHSLQDALTSGKLATAWHVVGYRIGLALAITAATSYVPYNEGDIIALVSLWVSLSLMLMLLFSVLTWVAEKIIFMGISIREEIDTQQNLGISTAHAFLTISVGVLLAGLLA